ncbi:MAG: hypothetical protein AAF602_19785 [Myxococcota bacterium]
MLVFAALHAALAADPEPSIEDAEVQSEDAEAPSTEATPPRTVTLEPPVQTGGSALDGLDQDAAAASRGALPLALPVAPLRGRFSARPLLEGSLLAGGERTFWAMRIGLVVTHQYWRLSDRTVQVAGQTELRASAPFGGASGRRFELSSIVGPWVGPVALRIGPVVRSDRNRWTNADLELPDALALGGRGDLAIEIGDVRAFAGIELAWLALGDRPPADPQTAILPVIGDETAYRLGLGRQGDRIFVGVHGTWRETAIGSEIDIGLRFGLRLF